MKLYIVGNLAPFNAAVNIFINDLGIHHQSKIPPKKQSNAFLINELFYINQSRVSVFAPVSQKKKFESTAEIIYELEIDEKKLVELVYQDNLLYLLDYDSTQNRSFFKEEVEISIHTIRMIAKAATLISATLEDHYYSINVDLSKYQEITLDKFKEQYQKQYASEWFKNPWSTMKEHIEKNNLKNMSDVYKYAYAHPTTRTAKVLQKMIGDPALLSNNVQDASQENDHSLSM